MKFILPRNPKKFSFLTFVLFSSLVLLSAHADEWVKVTSNDGKISVLFPDNIKADIQSQTSKTIVGKVKTYFGEHYGDGIVLAASGSDIPGLARMAGNEAIFDGSQKTFLEETKGTKVSSREITIGGAPANELVYTGNGYRDRKGPYKGRAMFIIVNKRMYIVNSVISKDTAENKAAEAKLFKSIQVAR